MRDGTYLLKGVVKLVWASVVVSSLATIFASNNRSRGDDNISCINLHENIRSVFSEMLTEFFFAMWCAVCVSVEGWGGGAGELLVM